MDSHLPSKPKDDLESQDDLGDDLMESTSVEGRERSARAVDPKIASEDELQSAQILMGESLWLQAKKALHRALSLNPSNQIAQKLLDEIRQKEFEDLVDPRHSSTPSTAEPRGEAAQLVQELDRDWNLGIREAPSQEFIAELSRSVLSTASLLSHQDRADLAVAFLQMEIPEITLSLLSGLKRLDPHQQSIRFWALLEIGRPFDCVQELEVWLRDDEIDLSVRRELEYLLARAREALGETEVAALLYSLLKDYRDSADRLILLKEKEEER